MSSALRQRAPLLLFAGCLIHGLFPFTWFSGILSSGQVEHRDWYHLKIVADALLAGEHDTLYLLSGELEIHPGYYWRYPPFVLLLVAPLAWLPTYAAYWAIIGVQVAAMVITLRWLHRLHPVGSAVPVWVTSVMFSAPFMSVMVVGQNSAVMLMAVVGAAVLMGRGHPRLAWAVLGLLAFKPNWGIFVGLYALARRDWWGAGIMLAVVGGLVLVSLPLGPQLWLDFVDMFLANEQILAKYPVHKLITFKGTLQSFLGVGSWLSGLWALSALGLLGAAAWCWRQPAAATRHLGVVMLLAVVANPYASFYDALVLVLPATVWWSERARYQPWARRSIGVLIATMWLGEQLAFYWLPLLSGKVVAPVSMVGICATLWLLLEAHQCTRLGAEPSASHRQPDAAQ
jgi:hypothetical protein